MMRSTSFGALMLCVTLFASSVAAQIVVPYKPNLRLHPFTSLPTQNFSFVGGATVSIEDGYASGDLLLLDYEGEFQITSKFDTRTGVMYIEGQATVSEYINIIESIVFTTTATDGNPRTLTWTLGKNTYYLSHTGHYYTYYSIINIAWGDAQADCATSQFSYFNMTGYLATVTSQAEMTGLGSKILATSWIGGAGNNATGAWSWQTGPEAGTTFWQGLSLYQNGTGNDEFSSWGRFQPYRFGNAALVPSAFEPTSSWQSSPSGVQSFVCEYGGMDASTSNAVYGGSVVLELACSLFTSPTDCNNQVDMGCAWSGTCVQTSCAKYTNEYLCAQDSKCTWATDAAVGVCTATQCGAFSSNGATCNAAPNCKFVTNINAPNQCLQKVCSDYQTSCKCSAATGCSWYAGGCGTTAGMNCSGLDVVYMIDGTSIMGNSFGLHPSGFVGLLNQLTQVDQFLTQTPAGQPVMGAFGQRVGYVLYGSSRVSGLSPAGTGTGGRLTGSRAEALGDLAYLMQHFPNSQSRTLTSAVQQTLTMIQNSATTGRKLVVVVVAAGAIADASLVAGMPGLAQAGATVIGVSLSRYPESTADSTGAVLSLMTALPKGATLMELAIEDFVGAAVWGICTPQLGVAKTFVSPCASYVTSVTCRASPVCGWSDASKTCQQSSCLANCQTECMQDSTCTWDNSNNLCKSACTTASCAPCVTNPTEDSCIADPNNCVYNASNFIKCQLDQCAPISDATSCSNTQGCTYITSQNRCARDPCTSRTAAGPAGCTKLQQCAWVQTNGNIMGCRLTNPCGMYSGERQCAADARCLWNVSVTPSACLPAPCVFYNTDPLTAVSKCNADSRCMWRYANQSGFNEAMCMVRTCDMHTTSCQCSNDNGCVWRNNTCKDSRYVQCSPIDLFFLVEASPLMATQFGRHPSGFVGIMESIRSWSQAAPWAAEVAATGFRMGMALYGGNAASTSPIPADGIGNGADFVTDGRAFYPVGKEIDFFQDAFTTYVNGQTSVQLLPGLLAAETMFNRTYSQGRTRMLVILGASAFVDGAAILDNGVLTRLRNSDPSIQFFTNIVRRFNAITAAETQASNYMLPVASEPSAAHFMFATIDEIRSTLLDQFCDPSTATGMALNINRDNTLPCNWLAKNECGMQTNCVWNGNATKTCPLAGQCPNLGCKPLPDNLVGFTCAQCTSLYGAITCEAGASKYVEKGVCQPNSCALNYCDANGCNSNPQCTWNPDTIRCESNLCAPITDVDTCNLQLGCYWNAVVAPMGCMRSNSWRQRSQQTCQAFTQPVGGNDLNVYAWKKDSSPAVCIQLRCENLDQPLCDSHIVSLGCAYDQNNLNGRPCKTRTCAYTNVLDCHADSSCYWNPFDSSPGTCNAAPLDGSCVLSGFSNYSQCTATCGNAIQYKSRRVLRFPTSTKQAASCEQIAANMGRSTREPTIFMSKTCTVPQNCTDHCWSYTMTNDITGCSRDISCFWNSTCQAKTFNSCAELGDVISCSAVDVCMWDNTTKFCMPVVKGCTEYLTASACPSKCHWRTGDLSNYMGNVMGLPVQLFSPGQVQEPIFVFPTLSIDSNMIIWGATVTIEQNFKLGKDTLSLNYPSAISPTWDPSSGTLTLTGRGTVNDYANAIRYVEFTSTAVDPNPRIITWSLLNGTVYSANSQHVYRYFPVSNVTFSNAQAMCNQATYFGLQGYLAAIQTQRENDIVNQKLWAEGWIGGVDTTSGIWRWNSGPYAAAPLSFWQGASSSAGGRSLQGLYANWNAIKDEPTTPAPAGTNAVYMEAVGTWHAAPSSLPADGFVCEFGGMPGDMPPQGWPITGAAIIGAGGCLPDACTYHSDNVTCGFDSGCYWNGMRCLVSCGAYGSPLSCGTDPACAWDDTVMPPMCSFNPCGGNAADCAANKRCVWDQAAGQCAFKTGCAARLSQATCVAAVACQWQQGTDSSTCITRPCESLSDADACGNNPLCTFVEGTGCTTAYCRAGNADDCVLDTNCMWNSASQNGMLGFNIGGNPIKPLINIPTPGLVGNQIVDGVTVMITGGFQDGIDRLYVSQQTLSANSWTQQWNADTGMLTLLCPPGTFALSAVSFAQNNVMFSTTSTMNTPRNISYALGANAFLSYDQTKFVKFVPGTGFGVSSYAAAQTLCSNTNFFGATGKLASLRTEPDALNAGRFGTTSWLGAQGSANVWRWTTGASAAFWDMSAGHAGPVVSTNTSSGFMFAYWTHGQPQYMASTATQYAMVGNNGQWATVGTSQPNGALCEFSIPMGIVGSSASVEPRGCFVKPCITLGQSQCLTTPGCSWNSDSQRPNTCAVDGWCSGRGTTPSSCSALQGCYWSYGLSFCATGAGTLCDRSTQTECNSMQANGCEWSVNTLARPGTSMGACISTACQPLSVDACMGNPLCTLTGTSCVNRQCPYTGPDHCFLDTRCQWDYLSAQCFPADCTHFGDSTTCANQGSCYWQDNQCLRMPCDGKNVTSCQASPSCIWSSAGCRQTKCYIQRGTTCQNNNDCLWVTNPTTQALQCITNRCRAYSSPDLCKVANETGSQCAWNGASCITGAAPGSCEKEVTPNLAWLWVLCVIIFALLALIVWRLYLAYAKGLSFFEPARTNVKYSPHQQYAADLFEEAQVTGAENNAGYQRPNINEL